MYNTTFGSVSCLYFEKSEATYLQHWQTPFQPDPHMTEWILNDPVMPHSDPLIPKVKYIAQLFRGICVLTLVWVVSARKKNTPSFVLHCPVTKGGHLRHTDVLNTQMRFQSQLVRQMSHGKESSRDHTSSVDPT